MNENVGQCESTKIFKYKNINENVGQCDSTMDFFFFIK